MLAEHGDHTAHELIFIYVCIQYIVDESDLYIGHRVEVSFGIVFGAAAVVAVVVGFYADNDDDDDR